MIVNDLSLSASERELLRETIGRQLAYVEGCVVGFDGDAWATVRLHFEDGRGALDVTSSEAVIKTTPSTSQEVCALRVSRAPEERLRVDVDIAPTRFNARGRVLGFETLQETIGLSIRGVRESKTMITQALVVSLPDHSLALDRGIWFNEAVKVSCAAFGTVPHLYDDGPDWLGDPEECPEETWSYERALLAINKG